MAQVLKESGAGPKEQFGKAIKKYEKGLKENGLLKTWIEARMSKGLKESEKGLEENEKGLGEGAAWSLHPKPRS